jgi:hypothetical protein
VNESFPILVFIVSAPPDTATIDRRQAVAVMIANFFILIPPLESTPDLI